MSAPTGDLVATVRDFNRFYTNLIGVLRGGLLDTPYTLTEARVIFELAQRDAVEVTELRRELDIDAGYLSRILGRFESDGLVSRERSGTDARRQVIRLTPAGRDAYKVLDERSAAQIAAMLDRLGGAQRQRLAGAMATIRDVLGEAPRPRAYLLRPPRPGDLGWVIARNAAIYADEYGWDDTYEALVARIVADYVAGRDPRREAAWIAELDGTPVGCVFCVRRDDETAQLRLLLVEPSARGLGIGRRLVDECLAFAKRAGYRRIMLWTNDVLADARRIYERAGFRLRDEEQHHSFGHDLVGQTWWRDLG
jgi:DNA-binding MarR family transcriptional regulator/GNAT superfamily N-acetyltransferase